MGVRVALEEEVQARAAGAGHGRAVESDGGGRVVLRLERAERAERLEPLVVPRGAVTRVDDRHHGAGGRLQDEDGGVEVVEAAEGRVEALPDGAHRHDVAGQEACHVQVVDRHVAEDAAGLRHVGGRWGGRVAADDRQLHQGSDLAGGDAPVDLGEARVEAAVEADHHARRPVADRPEARVDARQVEVDQLLGEDGLAGRDRADDLVDVVRRGRADDDGVDVRRGVHVRDVAGRAGAVPTGEADGRVGPRIGDEDEHRHRADGRPRRRHEHPPQQPAIAGPVETRRLDDLAGEGAEVVAHPERREAERLRGLRQDQRPVGVRQPDGPRVEAQRDDERLLGQHQPR